MVRAAHGFKTLIAKEKNAESDYAELTTTINGGRVSILRRINMAREGLKGFLKDIPKDGKKTGPGKKAGDKKKPAAKPKPKATA